MRILLALLLLTSSAWSAQRDILDDYVAPQLFTGNWQVRQDTFQMISFNDQIQPGSYGVTGTWQNGENAVITFRWSTGSATVGCTVGAVTGAYPPCDLNQFGEHGRGNNVIAQGLQYQIMLNANLVGAPIWSGMQYQAIPNYPTAGGYGFGYLTTRRLYNGGVGWSVSSALSTHPNQIVVNDPVNRLDGPTGLFLYRSRPPGSTEMPADYDYINGIQFLGATREASGGGIPLVRIDAFLRSVDDPVALLSINTWCPGGGGAANGNGCLRFSLAEGLSIGNTGIDPGDGSLFARDVIVTGGYTVYTLPRSLPGARAYITDQLENCPATGARLTPGGSKVCPVFYDGEHWVGG